MKASSQNSSMHLHFYQVFVLLLDNYICLTVKKSLPVKNYAKNKQIEYRERSRSADDSVET